MPTTNTPKIVMFTGIPGFQAKSTQVISDNVSASLRNWGVEVIEVSLVAPRLTRLIRPSILAEFMVRYIGYPLVARLTWRKFGNGAVYVLTDHASAFLACAIPRPAKVVVQVNDLTSLLPIGDLPFPPTWKHRLIHALGKCFKIRGIRRADHLLTISYAIRDQMLRYITPEESRITVVGCGVDQARFRAGDKRQTRQECGLDAQHEYLMTIAPASPRKNIPTVLRALAKLRETRPNIRLLYVGEFDRAAREIIAQRDLHDVIRQFKDVPISTLARLYQAADVYLFPSFYEGFGLPVVEAMACGCPIVISDIPALREVAGGAALTACTDDPGSWIERITDVLDDPSLAARYVKLGLERAQCFAWATTASRVLNVATTLNTDGLSTHPCQAHRPASVA